MNHWFKSHLLYLFVVEPPIWKICASQIGSSNQISGWKENIFNVWSENLNSYNIRSGIPSDAFRSRRLKVIILDKLAHWPASSAPGPRIPAAPAATWIQCQVDQKHPWSFTFDRMLREGLAHLQLGARPISPVRDFGRCCRLRSQAKSHAGPHTHQCRHTVICFGNQDAH